MSLISEARKFVAENIEQGFHTPRLASLGKLRLSDVLRRKNPYLYKAKNLNIAADLVSSLVAAHLSSQEESIFGGFLERLAVFVCATARGGRKSGIAGIDLEFEIEGQRHLVAIKSGPKWHNKGQLEKLRLDFRTACKTLNTNARQSRAVCINGCCYGNAEEDHGDFLKLCGERFWTLISGDPLLFVEIVEPLGHEAERHDVAFKERYAAVLNTFTRQFLTEFCVSDGSVDWEKIVRLNAGAKAPRTARGTT